jgi:hypothetical protein
MINRPELDALLPHYHVRTTHTVAVSASADRVYTALRTLDLSRSRIIRALFKLRGMPPMTLRAGGIASRPFITLRDVPNHAVILGIIGQFWRPSGKLQHFAAEEFPSLNPPNTAKGLWSFHIEPDEPGGVRVITETRVYCTDRRSLIAFRCYWTLIAPFSSWIRREILRLLAAQARAA